MRNWYEKVVDVIFIVLLVLLLFASWKGAKVNYDEQVVCAANGGIYISAYDGYRCVKLPD